MTAELKQVLVEGEAGWDGAACYRALAPLYWMNMERWGPAFTISLEVRKPGLYEHFWFLNAQD